MARQFLTDIELAAQRELRFEDADSSHYVGFKSPAVVPVTRIWTLPSADGTVSQVLSTNGSGVLSWATAGGVGANQADYGLVAEAVSSTADYGSVV